jgi:hypothetical protein
MATKRALLLTIVVFTVSALDPICEYPSEIPEDKINYPLKCNGVMGSHTDNVIPDEILFMEYNMDEAGHWKDVVHKIQTNFTVVPSVIFISEIDYGCSDTDRAFLIEDMAKALKMDYVYYPEFLEYHDHSHICTTGNGILSKFPVETMEYFRFDS